MQRLTPDQVFQVALQQRRAGQSTQARDLCQQTLAEHPDHPDLLHLQGVLAHEAGQRELAVRSLQRAAQLRPGDAERLHNLGSALLAAGRADEAVGVLRQALQLRPDSVEGMLQLGASLLGAGQLDEAADLLEQVSQRQPDNADAWNNLGVARFRLEQFDAAVAAFWQAVRIRPDAAAAHKNLGMALRATGRMDDALAAYGEAARLRPSDQDAQNNLGVTYEHMRQWSQAVFHYRRSMALKPDDPAPQWNLSRLLLLTADTPVGDWAEGWALFESRLRLSYLKLARPFAQPQWRGEPIACKTILLWTEGGFGDALHFIRYAPQVAQRGAIVLLECQPELVRLMQSAQGVHQVIPRGRSLPPFDVQIPLQSLPYTLRAGMNGLGERVPYLHPPAELVRSWRERLAGERRLRVGLAWAGSRNPLDMRSRLLSTFAPLAAVGDVAFFSLQKGADADQPAPAGMSLDRSAAGDADFADTAALMLNLDVIVSVDTSVVHLAGALGRPVFTLLPLHPDFRWMLDRPDTPWYPTMRLFRQTQRGDWSEPVAAMAAALREMVAARA